MRIPSVMSQLVKLDLSQEDKKKVVDFLNYFIADVEDEVKISLIANDLESAESNFDSSLDRYKKIFDIWSVS